MPPSPEQISEFFADKRTYKEKLKDPKWLRKREAILKERGEACQWCGETDRPEVHHGYYGFAMHPWEYDDDTLWVLCRPCHQKAQLRLIKIHKLIATIHPDDHAEVCMRLDNGTFDLQHGITKEEFEKILDEEFPKIIRREHEAELTMYSDYSLEIQASNDLGPTVTDEMERKAVQRFPGIQVNVYLHERNPDGVSAVDGPDEYVRSVIQAWADKWVR